VTTTTTTNYYYYYASVAAWFSGSTSVSINEVTLCPARLVVDG